MVHPHDGILHGLKRKAILVHDSVRMHNEDIMFSETSHHERTNTVGWVPMRALRGQRHRDRTQMVDARVWQGGDRSHSGGESHGGDGGDVCPTR